MEVLVIKTWTVVNGKYKQNVDRLQAPPCYDGGMSDITPNDLSDRVAVLEEIASSTKQVLADLRTEMRQGFAEMRTEMRDMRTEMRDIRTEHRWLGSATPTQRARRSLKSIPIRNRKY